MSLTRYEDFLELTKWPTERLPVMGITTSNTRKVELVLKSFATMDMGLGIAASSEEQEKRLKNSYEELSDKIRNS